MSDLTDAFAALDASSTWRSISSLFERMTLAEDAIARAKARHPDKADVLHDAFRILQPSPLLSNRPDRLYVAYCDELLDRVAAGEDTRPGTAAEVLVLLSEASLVAKPQRPYLALFEELFSAMYPDQSKDVGLPATRPEWPGQTSDILAELKRKLRQPTRLMSGARVYVPAEPPQVQPGLFTTGGDA